MPQMYAIANQKGGVGKTTTAAALLAVWAAAGQRVLGVDLDPQASLTTALGGRPSHSFYKILSAFIDNGEIHPRWVRSAMGAPLHGIDLLPSHLDLGGLEIGPWMQADRREYVLADVLGTVASDYDKIVIDCPPSLGLLTVNALVAAQGVLVPCTPEYLAAEGLNRLLATVARVQKRINKGLQIVGVIPTMVKGATNHHKAILTQIAEVCATWPVPIPVLTPVPDKISVADAAGQGIPITLFNAGNDAAEAYRLIAAQVEVPNGR